MEFLVLGPLRVEGEEGPYVIRGRKQRTALAMLVAAAGVPVSTELLLMALYGDDAEPRARRSLQTHIAALRRELGDVIRRADDGYVLAVEPSSIDAVRFEDALRDSREAKDESVAADHLRRGLRLWRGEAYADVSSASTLEAEARRLDELRVEAIERRIELDLLAGRHRQVIAELDRMVARYPLRERLRAHQMVALYRCGRQVDATRAYHQLADELRNQFGLEPSTELRRLELQILEHDPELEYWPRPRRRPLPARYTTFVGRDRECQEVEGAVDRYRLVTITGPGGVGKSSLAIEVGRVLEQRGEVVYVPVERRRSAGLWTLLAQSLGVSHRGHHVDVADAVVASLNEVPAVLLLDGCEHVIDQLPEVAATVLRRCSAVTVLVTSREGAFITGEHLIELGPLGTGSGSASNRLFADRAGIDFDELDDADVRRISAIGRAAAGLPLALELAAARMHAMSLAEIEASLDDQVRLLAAKRAVDQRHSSLEAALDGSFHALEPGLQTAFRRLGPFKNGVPIAGAAMVGSLGDPETALQQLVDVSLLTPPGPDGRYGLLEPIRQYAEAQLVAAGEFEANQMRYASWIASFCRDLWLRHRRDRDPSVSGWLRAEGAEFCEVARWALEHDAADIALTIVASIGRHFPLVLPGAPLLEIALQALHRAETGDDDIAVRALAAAAWMMGAEPTDIDVAQEMSDRLASAALRIEDAETLHLATMALALDPSRDATDTDAQAAGLEYYDRSLEQVERLGWLTQPLLYNRATFLIELGRLDEAETMLHDVLEWAGDRAPAERGTSLLLLAWWEMRKGRLDDAVEMAREAGRLLSATLSSFAPAAEAAKAHAHFNAGRVHASLEALRNYDGRASLVTLPAGEAITGRNSRPWSCPPRRLSNAALTAAVMADLGQWSDVQAAVRTWVDGLAQCEASARVWLLGNDHLHASELAYALYATVGWLAAHDRQRHAAALLGSAKALATCSRFDSWDALGWPGRFEQVAAGLEVPENVDLPGSMDELFWLLHRYAGQTDGYAG